MRAQSVKHAFNGGEVSPLAMGRTDHPRYFSWCEGLQNFIPLIQGGVTRRPGTRFVCNAMGPSRIVPFRKSVAQSFQLEFGNQTLQFYKNKAQIAVTGTATTLASQAALPQATIALVDAASYAASGVVNINGVTVNYTGKSGNNLTGCTGGTGTWPAGTACIQPYQVATPYNTASDNLWDLKFAQFGDLMYIFHPNHPVQKLNHLGDASWILNQPNFNPPPTHEFDVDIGSANADHAANITLTPAATTGTGVLMTASAGVFIAGDVGRQIIAGAGIAYIVAMGGSGDSTSQDPNTGATLHTVVTVDVLDEFASTSAIAAGQWFLRKSPQSYVLIGIVNSDGIVAGTRKLGTGQNQTVTAFANFPTESQPATAYEDTFRMMDVGAYAYIGGSCQQILAVVNSVKVTTRQMSTITQTLGVANQRTGVEVFVAGAISGGDWTLERLSLTAANGYPAAGAFCQDRLWMADTAAQPTQVWASVSEDYENFAKGSEDDDAIDEEVNNGSMEPIQWLAAYQAMVAAGTLESEIALTAGQLAVGGNGGPPITPDSFSAAQQSAYGVSPIQPLFVEMALIYLQRALQTAYEFTFDIYHSVYASKNLNEFNDIITTTGFKEMVYAQMPFRTLWFTDLGGDLIGLTYHFDRDEGTMFAWSRHFTGQDLWTSKPTPGTDSSRAMLATPPANGDQVISVSVIPDSTGLYDQLWMNVQRTVNGATVYCIEVTDLSSPLYVDCASTATFAEPVTSVGGMGYLAGRSVRINADGADLGCFTVPGDGTINFASAMPAGAKSLQIGLPVYPAVLPVRPEIQGVGETSAGLLKRWVKSFVRTATPTVGLKINGQEVEMRTVADEEDTGIPPLPGTNDYDVTNLGYDRDGQVLIEHPYALPCTLLSLFGRVEIGAN